MGDDAGAIPDVITRYFAAQSARDLDAIVGLFADDGVLIDEGQIRRGTEQIRDWRDNVAAVCEYTTEVRGVDRVAEGRYVARVRLEGNFPGGTVDLRHRFTVAGDKIHRLAIAP